MIYWACVGTPLKTSGEKGAPESPRSNGDSHSSPRGIRRIRLHWAAGPTDVHETNCMLPALWASLPTLENNPTMPLCRGNGKSPTTRLTDPSDSEPRARAKLKFARILGSITSGSMLIRTCSALISQFSRRFGRENHLIGESASAD